MPPLWWNGPWRNNDHCENNVLKFCLDNWNHFLFARPSRRLQSVQDTGKNTKHNPAKSQFVLTWQFGSLGLDDFVNLDKEQEVSNPEKKNAKNIFKTYQSRFVFDFELYSSSSSNKTLVSFLTISCCCLPCYFYFYLFYPQWYVRPIYVGCVPRGKEQFLQTNSSVVQSCTVTDADVRECSCSFHARLMLATFCFWSFPVLVRNLPGECMVPDTGNSFKTYMEPA